ncbi:hypothetical protein IGB42_02065 [Andreprevotia sp. IGB-42]|uniref:eCIS core domain-containing protein n=1 Tax=Andreprevotia sp. IGB-42 TaxID=2497473 RepID=UPI001358EFEC|nr:DUF4157 domain-containing protein [Andreprevotia sp. IGB-42]KAF0813712.1 hypothetical protein IGB42_02065 [Andreprevotia sp. IGB-42]
MKSLAQLARAKPAKQTSRVQKRTGAAQSDSRERQAEHLGQRFARGDGGLGKQIRPALAAAVSLPGSRGDALPVSLRGELETAFDSDLSAVRIHRDAAAHAAARQQQAQAFVSGAHIYFGEGQYVPETSAGRALIGHELTHVLQQTGRRASNRLWSATDVQGGGVAQRSELRQLPRRFTTTQSLTRLADIHATATTSSDELTALRALETTLRGLLGDELGQRAANRQLLIDRVRAAEWDSATPAALGLLADTLRALRASEAAAGLLLIAPDLKCVLHDTGTQEFGLEAVGNGWLAEQLAREPLRRFFPRQFVDTFRTYLMAPRRAIQSLVADDPSFGDFVAWERQLIQSAEAGGDTLVENELFFFALDHLRIANEERVQMMSMFEARANQQVGTGPAFLKRLSVAEQLLHGFEGIGPQATSYGSVAVYGLVAERIRNVAQRAIDVWRAVRDVLAGGSAPQRLRDQANTPTAQQFRTTLEAFATTVFARDASARLPAPGAYRTALNNANARLRTYAQSSLEAPMISMSRRDEASFDLGLATWYGLILAYLPELQAEAASYDYQADVRLQARFGSTTTLERQWGNDLRIAHRLALARKLYQLASGMQWQALMAQCDAVATATDNGGTESQFALTGDWHRDGQAAIADFSGGESGMGFEADTPIRGLGFLTSRQLANVFLAEYFSRASDAIEAILTGRNGMPGEEGNFDVDRETIRSRTRATLEAIPRPRRYTLTANDYRLAINAVDGVPTYHLVMAHPKTQQFLNDNAIAMGVDDPFMDFAIFPVAEPAAGGTLFFWSVPPLQPVVDRLRRDPTLDALIRAVMMTPALATTSVDPALLGSAAYPLAPVEDDVGGNAPAAPFWFRWLNTFTSLDAAQVQSASAGFGTAVQTEAGDAQIRYLHTQRRAWVQDRQLLVKFRVLPLLESYRHIGVDTYNNPTEAIHRLQTFTQLISPDTDAPLHGSLAVLELFRPPASGAIDIVTELSQSERYDLIIVWQAALNRAIRAAASDARVLLLDLMTPAERADQAWLDASVARMQALVQAMEAIKARVQLQTGFVVRPQGEEDPAHAAFMVLPGTRELSGAEPFTINGIVYQLVSAAHTVEFHPDYGSQTALDSYRPSQLIVDGVPVEADPVTRQRTGTRELFRIIRNGRMLIVRENDDALLEELNNATGMEAIVRNLQELEAFIEWSANLAMDALEFVPGAGQVLMATRLAASILGFIASPEFDEIKTQVLDNPTGFIEGLIDVVSGQLFEPDRFINWALLTGLVPAAVSVVRNPRPPRRPATGSRSGGTIARFGQLMQRLSGLGVRFGHAVNRMRVRAGQSFISMESFVQSHPVLAMGFEMIGEFADYLEPSMIAEAQRMLVEAGVVMTEVQEAFLNFPEHIGELVHTINSLQLPREIIPMDQVLDVLINLVVERLSAKYRLVGRGILFVLDQLGLKQQILDAIVAQLPESGNPNHYWAEFVDDTLQPRLNEIRTDLIAGFNNLLDRFNFPAIPTGTGADAQVVPHGTDFPEGDASPSDTPADPLQAIPATPGAGQPLAPHTRQRMESQFGHDFSHVRLHSEGAAAGVTRRFGADGLATGSHVYLAPGLSPERGKGQQVLRHELAHVLQQTGPRPLAGGTSRSSAPVVPSARGGLRFDSGAEQSADAMALQAAQGGTAPRPIPVRGGRVGGWQPALGVGTVGRMIRRLSRGEAVLAHYRRMDPEHGGTVPATTTLPATVTPQLANVHEKLRHHIRNMAGWPSHYPDALCTQIKNYYTDGNRVSELQHAVARIAGESLVEHRPRAAAGSAPAAGPVELRLNIRVFERAIEAYFLERGLGLRVSLAVERRDDWNYLVTAEPVRSISFAFLNMGQVGSGSALWEVLMANTWTGATRGSPLWEKYQGRTRTYLEARGPTFGIYGRPGLVLSGRAKQEIETLAIESTSITLAHVPSKADYVSGTGAGARNQGSGVLALVTGRYGDSNQTGGDRGMERESHHTTQFLLIEYFSNWHSGLLKPFKHPLPLYAPVGLTADGDQPVSFQPATGSAIGIKSLAGTSQSARGPEMPVISVANTTHRRGRLHIQGIMPPPGFTDASGLSQSLAVHMEFRSHVTPQPVHDALFGDEAAFRAFTATPQGRTDMRAGIHHGMQATYRWMRDDMMGRLDNGLRTVEKDYYNNTLAQPAGRSDRLSPDEMAPAFVRAQNNNRDIMESRNHWA